MGDIAGWFAPIATMLAACVTAANLGARVTGWGFVIFTFGSIAWTAYGYATDQPNLLWQNLALTAVNLFGIWRWLIRQARLDDWARAAAEKSERRTSPTLFPVSNLTSAPVTGRDGAHLGTAVDAMVRCQEGQIAYLVVNARKAGALGGSLHILPWNRVRASPGGIETDLGESSFGRLELADAAQWPTRAPQRDDPPD
ncbi:MAG TPA: PRC-barrel domain-containing protein [Allosphingosinicella sp.]|nr:PRC-barrel domain-containing protein [Allosphingosinicella sp.]